MGASLLVPYSFSDPNGVDPYVARIGAVSLLLLGAALLSRRLAAARPVLIALASIAASYTVLSAMPQLLSDLLGERAPSADAEVFWASLAQLTVTAGLAVLALRRLGTEARPRLRLGRFGPGATAATLVGPLLLIGAGLALPAALLGREAVQPTAALRDLPWLWPANLLQALSQEVQFRGLLMGALERVSAKRWANLGQAIFFGLAHLAVNYEGPVGPFVPVTIAAGLLLGWVVQRTNSLWPAVAVHAVADIAITVAVVPGLYGY